MKVMCFFSLVFVIVLSACSAGTSPDAGRSPATAAGPTVEPATPFTSAPEPTAALTATSTAAAELTVAPTPAPTTAPEPAPEPTATTVPAPEPTVQGVSAAAGACANRYLPVAQGATWQYRISGITSGTFTRVIAALRPDGFDDKDTFDVGVTRAGSWTCRDGDLIALTPSSGPMVATAEMQFDFIVESNEGITLPADPQPSQTWTQTVVYRGEQTVGNITFKSRNVAETLCKAIGMETVSVPAGDFEALRVDCASKVQASLIDAPAGVPGMTFETTDTRWFAPGVGLLRSSGTTDLGATEIVLLSYSAP